MSVIYKPTIKRRIKRITHLPKKGINILVISQPPGIKMAKRITHLPKKGINILVISQPPGIKMANAAGIAKTTNNTVAMRGISDAKTMKARPPKMNPIRYLSMPSASGAPSASFPSWLGPAS